MKIPRILTTLVIAASAIVSTKGYSNPRALPNENHSEKIYIDSSRLSFSGDGIFLRTLSDDWRQIGYICHDSNGYYLPKYKSAQDTKNKAETIWICPKCFRENTSTSGVCEHCLWPLYEWD